MKKPMNPKPATLAVWAGEDHPFWERSTQVPVVHSVSFGYDDVDEWLKIGQGKSSGHIYSRNTNPTVQAFEEKAARLEGAEAATGFASGMAAISNTLFAFLSPGDRIVSIKDSYGGTNKLFTEFLPRFQIDVTLCDTTDQRAIEKAVAEGCRMLYLESPTNPTLKVVDIAGLSKKAHDAGALVAVDSTFATPILQKPLELGADLVLHSATKFLGGHADALGGVVCGPSDLIAQIYHFREINGAANLGSVETIAGPPATTSHVECTTEERAAMGIPENLVRYSVGIEDANDLISDLEQALGELN